jgi:hypothetical protein
MSLSHAILLCWFSQELFLRAEFLSGSIAEISYLETSRFVVANLAEDYLRLVGKSLSEDDSDFYRGLAMVAWDALERRLEHETKKMEEDTARRAKEQQQQQGKEEVEDRVEL